MTLAEVLGRGVSIEWYEGVAIVRAVMARLSDGALRSDLFPDLHEIDILPDGQVTFGGRNFVRDRVARAHRLLQHLLAEAAPPLQLRLFLSRTSLGSLREYDESLAYFERPDRAQVLTQLHARALRSAAPINAALVLNRVDPPPAEKARVFKPETRTSRRAGSRHHVKRRLKILGAAAVVLVVAAAASYSLTSSSTDRAEAPTIVQKSAQPASDPHKPAPEAAPESAEREVHPVSAAAVHPPSSAAPVRLGSSAAPVGPPSNAAPAAAVQVPVQRSRADARPPGAGQQVVPVQSPTAPVAAPPTAPAAAPPTTPVAAPPTAVVAAPPTGELLGALTVIPMRLPAPPSSPSQLPSGSSLVIEAFADNEPPIYSAGSPGVVPPVSLMPPLPPALPANIDPQDIGRIELIIGGDGVVESVKLIAVPGNVPHSMLLSAVKAWKFEPAMKDGMPVRYRQSVWLGPSVLGDPFSWHLAR